MDKALWVFVGGGLGSVLRYALALLVSGLTPEQSQTPHWVSMYPIATLGANIIGCGLIGVAWGLLGPSDDGNQTIRLLLIVGVLGGFTTFSSFGLETIELVQADRVGAAGAYVLLSVIVGLFAVWCGFAASQYFASGGN
jgi:CrcB protein